MMGILHDETGKPYSPEIVLDNLRKEWQLTGQLAYPDMKLLWECIDAIRREVESFREMDLEGDNRSEYDRN